MPACLTPSYILAKFAAVILLLLPTIRLRSQQPQCACILHKWIRKDWWSRHCFLASYKTELNGPPHLWPWPTFRRHQSRTKPHRRLHSWRNAILDWFFTHAYLVGTPGYAAPPVETFSFCYLRSSALISTSGSVPRYTGLVEPNLSQPSLPQPGLPQPSLPQPSLPQPNFLRSTHYGYFSLNSDHNSSTSPLF